MHQGEGSAPDASEREGRYANYFKVGHNAYEFVLDFGQFYPESQHANFHTRIITPPVYAKALLAILEEAIAQYEQTFGAIQGG
jgi:hypothetical protein